MFAVGTIVSISQLETFIASVIKRKYGIKGITENLSGTFMEF